ncbi:MAG: penicillin-binding protein activator LpoB [Phycisphaerales bacterium]|nr:penicillin-binding protein activator LpoB [Phycisphaerales bacterium]
MPRTTTTLALSIVTALLVGCGSSARYTEAGGTESIVSIGQVDIQDINKAASGLLESMIRNGVLNRAPNKPARVIIENMVNDTSSDFRTDDLLYRMRSQLVNSGQAEVEMGYEVGGRAESSVANARLRNRANLEGKTSAEVFKPDFILIGKITEMRRVAGRNKQYNYVFRLTLVNDATGREAWTDQVDVQKSGTKSGVGF